MQEYRTVLGSFVSEYTVQRSKFIASIAHTETEEQATQFIKEIKSKYWDAKHNVFAYSLREANLKRFSDDGEPQGTAGKPVLDVIVGNMLVDTTVVVTRYFGGILLGTGGLVRAYSKSAKDAVLGAQTVLMKPCLVYEVICAYSDYNTLEYLLKNFGAQIVENNFGADISVKFSIESQNEADFIKKCNEKFGNSVKIELVGENYVPFEINL